MAIIYYNSETAHFACDNNLCSLVNDNVVVPNNVLFNNLQNTEGIIDSIPPNN
jgi:hypothetical protein